MLRLSFVAIHSPVSATFLLFFLVQNISQTYAATPAYFGYNEQQYRHVPNTIKTFYKRVPTSLFNLTDEEDEIIDLMQASETCNDHGLSKITSLEECRRAAQEL